jgi:hypothetical protein
VTTEIDQLILKATGEEEVRRLIAALEAEEKALRTAVATHGAHDAATRTAAQNVLNLQNQLRASEANLTRASAASGGLNQAISTLSFTANDATQFFVSFRAGTQAIANNIPGVVSAMQTLRVAGFAGVMSALAGPQGLILGMTTAAALVPIMSAHWGDLQDAFGLGGTKTAAEEMSELGKKTKLTADEQRRLNDEKEREKALQGAAGPPKAVSEVGSAAGKAIAEFGIPGATGEERLISGLAQARGAARGGTEAILDPQDKEKIAGQQDFVNRLKKGLTADSSDAYRLGIENEERKLATIRSEAIAKANKELVDQATTDVSAALAGQRPGGLKALISEVQGTPGAFPKGLAESLQTATGETSKAKEAKKEKERIDKENEREQEQIIAEDERESERRLKARRTTQDKRVDELAKNLAPNLEEAALSGERVDRNRVRSDLIRTQGLKPEDAEKSADAVLKVLIESFNERIKTRAGEKGITLQEAHADLLNETLTKGAEEGLKEAEEARRKEEKVRKERVEDAKKSGADILAESAAKSGGNARQIRDLLISRGIDPDAAKTLGDEAFQGEQKSRLQEALTPERPRTSEVLGAEGLASAIQRSVGGPGDTAEKSLRVQERQLEVLNRLYQQGGAVAIGGPPPTRARRA